MRKIGLHLRFQDSLIELAHKANNLPISFFQFFVVFKGSGQPIEISPEERSYFIEHTRNRFESIYVHGSYWINLAGIRHNGFQAFKREVSLAKSLGATHFIIHPGSAQGAEDKVQGIQALAQSLNKIMRTESDINIVLENIAHGAMSVGGDIQDFGALKELLDYPEKLLVCIDTAHAYSYGYDLSNAEKREEFIQMLVAVLGSQSLHLIHLNDTSQACGSKIDKHEIIGQGHIGLDVLRSFVMDMRLAAVPVLLEPPVVPESQELEMLELVRSWHA